MAKTRPAEIRKIIGLTLADVKIDFYMLDVRGEDEAVYRYDVTIDDPDILSDGVVFFETRIVLRKFYPGSDNDAINLEAVYYCGVGKTADRKEAVSIAKHYAEATVWTAFTSLAGVILSQMHMQFPILPVAPLEIHFASDKEASD